MNDPHCNTDYLDVSQHWSASTEAYAGGDVLITFLLEGWLFMHAQKEVIWFGVNRRTTMYHVTLYRDGMTFNLPVLENPYIKRIIMQEEQKEKVKILSD